MSATRVILSRMYANQGFSVPPGPSLGLYIVLYMVVSYRPPESGRAQFHVSRKGVPNQAGGGF